MSKTVEITCPYCNKDFSLDFAKKQFEQRQAHAIELLKQDGFSLREIGRMMGGLHPQVVKNALAKLEVKEQL